MRSVPEISLLVESYIAEELITNSTSTSYINKLVLNFTPTYTGKYFLNFYCETAISKTASVVNVKILEGVNIYQESSTHLAGLYAAGIWSANTGFKLLGLVKDVPISIIMQFKVSTPSTGYIRFARMNIKRVF